MEVPNVVSVPYVVPFAAHLNPNKLLFVHEIGNVVLV